MLHEVLLALSGHPSPLFSDFEEGDAHVDFPLLTASERALLQTIGRLSETHRKLKRHLDTIRGDHPSLICRAVASSIQQTHLGRFQQRIIDVESKILKKDASLVGAYNIVPLASVVCEFDDWHRRMTWYWELACFLTPCDKPAHATGTKLAAHRTGCELINKLRDEMHTGFTDIRETAIELAQVAEKVWIKQLTFWVVYGKLPPHLGAGDFDILSAQGGKGFVLNADQMPTFVTPTTGASILFIGKSLHQVQQFRRSNSASITASVDESQEQDLISSHLKLLSTLALPLVSGQLLRTVSALRLSLSQNVLQHLLPLSITIRTLSCLRQYFLLDRSEFANILITETDERVKSRQQDKKRSLQQDPVKALQGLSIKEAELGQTMQHVWRLMLLIECDGGEDQILEYAQQHVTLSLAPSKATLPSTSDSMESNTPSLTKTAFNDLLLPIPTELSLKIDPPLDLFISPEDLRTYSFINTYLLGIKRGCLKLSDLWRRTSARRHTVAKSSTYTKDRVQRRARAAASRRIWATCSAANFMLTETAAYFERDVIKESCDHLQLWAEKPAPNMDVTTTSVGSESTDSSKGAQRDPETLATGHRAFLSSLTYALLLTNEAYTKELRSLLSNIDNLIAFFDRLLDVQHRLDLEIETGGDTAYTVEEEERFALEVDRARKKVDSDLKSVVYCLRQIDLDRIGSLRYLNLTPNERCDFEPWKAGGVDRLLMKLEFGRMLEPTFSIA